MSKNDSGAASPPPPRRWLNVKGETRKRTVVSELQLLIWMVAGCTVLFIIAINAWGLKDDLRAVLRALVKLFV